MARFAYRYPDGAAGLALLSLRVGYALVALGLATVPPTLFLGAGIAYPAAGLGSLCLLLGFATRWIALLLGATALASLVLADPGHQLQLAGHVGGCVAIALMGAGAYSIDARRHGHRVIQLQAGNPDRGTKD